MRSTKHTAICYMLVSTAAFSLMNMGVRLVAQTMDATLIVTLRNLITLLILLPLVAPHRFAVIRTTRLKAHFWRSAIGAVGMITWTYCLTIMPLVHATALSFTAPLLATFFAITILKEKATWRHLVALSIGFIGVLIILRPGIEGFDLNSLWVIMATTAWANHQPVHQVAQRHRACPAHGVLHEPVYVCTGATFWHESLAHSNHGGMGIAAGNRALFYCDAFDPNPRLCTRAHYHGHAFGLHAAGLHVDTGLYHSGRNQRCLHMDRLRHHHRQRGVDFQTKTRSCTR